MLAIIPCCGFGTRVKMKPNESKEMLLDSSGKPIINYSLKLCKKYNLDPLFLVRKEKQDLINYLKKKKVKYLIMEPGNEWSQTIYNSKEHWDEKNILLLPDTRFEPIEIIEQIKKSLEFGYDLSYAVHKVSDCSKWGIVSLFGYIEKPQTSIFGNSWGLIGFTKEAGSVIFKNMENKSCYYKHEFNTNFVFLDKFEDITRGN